MSRSATAEIARFEARRRLKGSIYLGLGVAAFAVLFVSFFPSMADVDLEDWADAFPPVFQELFGIEAMGSIEGFLAVELYQFVWVLLLGLYLAYLGGDVVAGDADADRLDVLLSLPLSRERIVAERAASLLPVIVVPNLLVPPVVYASVVAIGESMAVQDLLAVHALSVPYLAVCGAIGVVCSVVLRDGDLAQRVAVGLLFALYLLESLAVVADRESLGAISPMRYYDPTAILVHGEYQLWGATLLAVASLALVGGAAAYFRRVDAP